MNDSTATMHAGPPGSIVHVLHADAGTVAELAAIDWNRCFRRVCLDPVRGVITLMAPSRLHDNLARILDNIVDVAGSTLTGATGGLPSARLRRLAAVVLPALAMLAVPGPAHAEGGGAVADGAGIYAGVFAGLGRADSRVVDVDGFSNWGNPGWAVDYDDTGFAGGALIGRRFGIGGVPLRVELDGTFGDMSAKTNRIDPGNPDDPDETVESGFRWIATARAGVERAIGPATIFASAGLALARVENSLTDLDRGLDRSFDPPRPTPWRMDPDDSFRDGSTESGWVIGVGLETPLADSWTLRFDGSYLDFGESTHYANRSGNNRCCGADTPRRPVSYRIENRLGIVRLALIRRFGGP